MNLVTSLSSELDDDYHTNFLIEFSIDLFYVKGVNPISVVGFGALNLDLIFEVEELTSLSTQRVQLHPGKELWGSEEDFRVLSEQLKRCGTLKSKSGGGSAANTIVSLARMGFSTKFIGKVGQDDEGDFLLEQLGSVQTDLIQRGGRSGVCLVILDRHSDRFLFVRGNANNTLVTHDLDPVALREASWIHLTSFTGDPPFEAQKDLLDRLAPSVKVSMDPGEIYAHKGLDKIQPLIRRSTVLFVTENEIEILMGGCLSSGAEGLLEMGPSIVVCKRGLKGSRVFTEQEDFEVPALPVKVVDNTGAGDVYDAGFLAGLFLGKSLVESARFAAALASKSVAGYGRTCYPTREDLDRFFSRG